MTKENPMSPGAKGLLRIGKVLEELDGQIVGIESRSSNRMWVTVKFPVDFTEPPPLVDF